MAQDIQVMKLTTQADDKGTKDLAKSLEDLANEAQQLGKDTKDSGESAEAAEAKFTNFANNALSAFTGFVGAMVFEQIATQISGAVVETAAWSTEFNKLEAATAATGAEMTGFKDSAMDIYTDGMGENMEAVVTAMQSAETITGAWGDELETLTAGAITLDSVFEAGIDESIRAADQTMLQFGVTGEEAMDLLANTFSAVGDPMDDLNDTVQEYSSTFAESGYSAEQMFMVLQNGSEAGIYAFDKTADAVREFGIRFKEGTDEQAGAWDTLIAKSDEFVINFEDGSSRTIDNFAELQTEVANGNITIADAGDMMQDALAGIEDPIERARIATTLIGTQFEDLGEGIIDAFDTDGAIENVDGSMGRMQNTMQKGLMPAIERLSRTFKVSLFKAIEPVLVQLIDDLIPAMEDFADFAQDDVAPAIAMIADEAQELGESVLPVLNDGIETVTDLFNDGKDKILQFAEYFGKAAAAGLAVVGTFATVSAITAGVSAAFAAAGAAVALLSSPIVLLVAALVALQYAYEENFMGFGDTVREGVDAAKVALDEFLGFVTGLVDAFKSGGIEGAGDFIKTSLIDPLVAGIQQYITSGQLVEDAKKLGAAILDGISTGMGLVADAGTWLNTNLITPLSIAAQEFVNSGGLKDAMFALGKGLMDALKLGVVLLGGVMGFIALNVIAPLAESVISYVSSGQLWDNLKSLGTGLWEGIKAGINAIGDIAGWVLENLIVPFAAGVLTSLTDPTFIAALQDMGKAALVALSEGLLLASDWVSVNLVNPLTNLITGTDWGGAINSIVSKGKEIVEALGAELVSGISGLADDFTAAINGMIPDSIKINIGSVKVGIDPFSKTIDFGSVNIPLPDPFRQGGFTGFGGLAAVAGNVHFGETVVPHEGMFVKPSPDGLQAVGGSGGGSQMMNVTVLLDGEVIYNRMEEIKKRRAP